jgi:hypothetical protein
MLSNFISAAVFEPSRMAAVPRNSIIVSSDHETGFCTSRSRSRNLCYGLTKNVVYLRKSLARTGSPTPSSMASNSRFKVRYGAVRSFSAMPKTSEKTFFYPSFLALAPKRPLKGGTPLRIRSCGGEVPRIGSLELRGR